MTWIKRVATKPTALAVSERFWSEWLYFVLPAPLLLWLPSDIQLRLTCLCGCLVLIALLRDLRESRGASFREGLHFVLEGFALIWAAAWTRLQMPDSSRVAPIGVWIGAIAFAFGLHAMRWLERRPGSGAAYVFGLSFLVLLVCSFWFAVAIAVLFAFVRRLRSGVGAKAPVPSHAAQAALGCGFGLVSSVLAQATSAEWIAIGLSGSFVFLLTTDQAEWLSPLMFDGNDAAARTAKPVAADNLCTAMCCAAGFLMLVIALMGAMTMETTIS